MGSHDYCAKWNSFAGEVLKCRMEAGNIKEKYTIAVTKKDEVVGHLMKGQSGRFAKNVIYFLRDDQLHSCAAVLTGKPVNER